MKNEAIETLEKMIKRAEFEPSEEYYNEPKETDFALDQRFRK